MAVTVGTSAPAVAPGKKRCPACKKVKPIATDFTWRGKEERPQSWCKACTSMAYKTGRWGNPKRPKRTTLDPQPLRDFLAERLEWETQAEICGYDETIERRFNEIIKGRRPTIELKTVDMILTRMGLPNMVYCLYPLDDA